MNEYIYQLWDYNDGGKDKVNTTDFDLTWLKTIANISESPMYIERFYTKMPTVAGTIVYKNQAMQDLESDTVYRFQHPNE